MKILIDSRVVAVYDILPDVFKLRELLTFAKIPLKEEKQLFDTLQRMRELGLIHKTKGKTRKWTKEHDTIREWFDEFVSKIENEQVS
jgi:hypothetical protein